MYLKLWSLPEASELFSHEKGWTYVGKYPVYRVEVPLTEAAQGALPEPWHGRSFQLLFEMVRRYGAELRDLAPQAAYIGSARGELHTLVERIQGYISGERLSPRLSPETSLGSLGSVLARQLGIQGPAVVVSQTCLSGLLALHQAALHIRSGEGHTVLFGAVEAPLVPFFVETMAAMRIYTTQTASPFVRPGAVERENTFALGEGAVLGIVSREPISAFRLEKIHIQTAIAREGVSFTAVDAEALADLLREMGQAPDFVILHAPGTRQGDAAEWNAIQSVWGAIPALSIKAYIGHTLGAAPLLGLVAALHLMSNRQWVSSPYRTFWTSAPPSRWREAVVIGLGYGGVMGAMRVVYEA